MKPLTLTLKNFGPYIDETIDFRNFEDSSLFLISGKTGSGKTTIFDGMSYALFGESSGKLRQGKEMRSTFADPSEPTEVQLSFSHGEYLYEITRKPEQELYKKRGDGTRTQGAKISLIVKDHEGKELREYTKRREVDSFVQELLHLDATQFAQIVLLPQGEFRTFLIANSNDKEKVLRNLFGTQLYQKLNEQLKQQLKIVNQGIEETQRLIKAKLDQLYWKTPLVEEISVEEQLLLVKSQQKSLEEQQETEQLELTLLKKQKQEKEQEKFTMEDVINDFAKQRLLFKQKDALEQRAEMIGNLRSEEKQLQWVRNHQVLIEKTLEKTEAIATYEQQLIINQKEQTDQQHLLQQWVSKQKEHTGQRAEMNQIKENILQLQFQLPLYEEKEKITHTMQVEQVALEEALKKLTELKEQQRKTELNYQKEMIILEQQPKIEKECLALERRQEQWTLFLENWKQLQQCAEKEIDRKQQLVDQKKELTQAIIEKETIYQQVKAQKSSWAKMQISRLSLFLIEGEPCPVCGALEHPNQKEHQEFSLEEIQLVETKLNEVEEAAQKQEAQTARLQTQVAQTEYEIKELSKEFQLQTKKVNELSKQLQEKQLVTLTDPLTEEGIKQVTEGFHIEAIELEKRLAQINIAQKNVEILTQQVKEQQENTEEQETIVAEKQQHQLELQTQIKTMSEQLTDASLSLNIIIEKKQRFEEQFLQWENSQKEVEEHVIKLKENQLLLKNTEEHLLKDKTNILAEKATFDEELSIALSQSGFDLNQVSLQNLLKDVSKLEAIHAELSQFDKEKDQLLFQLDELEQKLADKEQPEMTQILAEIEELSTLIQQREETYYQVREKIIANENIHQQVTALITSIEEKWEEVTALHQLSATVNGDNPRKTSLERYVLQTYLEEVLTVANQRLGLLTNHRYQFELNQDSGSYKNQTGLEINVYDDNAGSSRSAHTLSGGESFIAALALALSLAEVIQEQAGGVLIEALFIDEGFGSLDEEALEMAMEALETIENEGRMIGIISHVSELKARIPQQLQIQTNGNGQSTVTYQTA
ncbi:AAA family ATPase [Candidatus Enterococcus mansonii]|uniref:Nuclease SbcCD subunit C n=1 Tax=Candidatus Enterococcus mansonii TaxID=1834181 RepID=A0A242CIB5_9ENTE|nr:SMC family ATPase [Enterococcus sp. 4G2_DIV0659]OTO09951.1 hypothetical protein A5880_000634 [Enterococcus sp. 4G2_DIV0659]